MAQKPAQQYWVGVAGGLLLFVLAGGILIAVVPAFIAMHAVWFAAAIAFGVGAIGLRAVVLAAVSFALLSAAEDLWLLAHGTSASIADYFAWYTPRVMLGLIAAAAGVVLGIVVRQTRRLDSAF